MAIKTFEISLPSYGSDLLVEIGADEDSLGVLYLSAKACGVLPLMFSERVPTLREFLATNLRSPECCLIFAARPWHLRGTQQREVLGAAFLHDVVEHPGVKRVELGLMFLRRRSVVMREALAPENTERMVRMGLDWIFGEFGATVLWSLAPASNRASKICQQALGFKVTAELPNFMSVNGKAELARLLVLDKETYTNGRSIGLAKSSTAV